MQKAMLRRVNEICVGRLKPRGPVFLPGLLLVLILVMLGVGICMGHCVRSLIVFAADPSESRCFHCRRVRFTLGCVLNNGPSV
jgi:hypothetical protein